MPAPFHPPGTETWANPRFRSEFWGRNRRNSAKAAPPGLDQVVFTWKMFPEPRFFGNFGGCRPGRCRTPSEALPLLEPLIPPGMRERPEPPAHLRSSQKTPKKTPNPKSHLSTPGIPGEGRGEAPARNSPLYSQKKKIPGAE